MAPAAPLGKPRCYIIPVCRNGWAPIPANNTYGWVPTSVDRNGWAPFLSHPFLSTASTGIHSWRQEGVSVARNPFLSTGTYSWRQACDNALLPTGMPANNTWACRGAPPAPFSRALLGTDEGLTCTDILSGCPGVLEEGPYLSCLWVAFFIIAFLLTTVLLSYFLIEIVRACSLRFPGRRFWSCCVCS